MYRLNDSAMSTLVDDETVILDSAGGKYYGLNATGTRMLAAILETQDLQAAVARMSAEYEVEQEKLRKDLEQFIATMSQRGLLLVETKGPV
jgi:hypothetical protein